jgi:hypothetical protein
VGVAVPLGAHTQQCLAVLLLTVCILHEQLVAVQTEVQSLKARLADKPAAAGLGASSDAAAAGAGDAGCCLSGDSKAGLGPASSGFAVGAACGNGGALSSGTAVCSSAEAETLAWIDALAQVRSLH